MSRPFSAFNPNSKNCINIGGAADYLTGASNSRKRSRDSPLRTEQPLDDDEEVEAPVRSENYKIKCKHVEEILIINVHLKKCNLLLHVMKSTIFRLTSSPS
jgi:hypothetical protein